MRKSFFWKSERTPSELQPMLRTLAKDYPLAEDGTGLELCFRKTDDLRRCAVVLRNGRAIIEYGCIAGAGRGLGNALSGLESDEHVSFETLGIMLDCSRNAVMTVEHFKRWLRMLALLGYNVAMLYTEDTYRLPDEPYFGYMRGAYSIEEIREIDRYAKSLNIEIIACIQTLGHLEQIIKWSGAYAEITDTARVLLVDNEHTYKLIEKMIVFWKEALSGDRIHIGMDEAHDLGRGKFMDKFGYERGFDIFNRHLSRIFRLCRKHGLKPMIWSDMYFRMGNSNQDYYDLNSSIPNDVRKTIPAELELVYWDYYHNDKQFYTNFIKLHRELGYEPLMASGVWTWSRLWYDHVKTVDTARPCIEACREAGVKELLFTLWGDDGAFCEFDSALAGLCWAAEISYGGDGNDKNRLEQYFKAICGGSYAAHLAAGEMEFCDNNDANSALGAHCILWDDPLMGMYRRNLHISNPDKDMDKTVLRHFVAVRDSLGTHRDDTGCGNINHAWLLLDALCHKVELLAALHDTYVAGSKAELEQIANVMLPANLQAYRALTMSFRQQWLHRNKPFGLEVIQSRMAAQIARLEEARLRIHEYLDGTIDSIAELDEELDTDCHITYSRHCRWATGSIKV